MVNGSLVNGFSEGLLVDPNAVTWYDTKDYNTGVDFSTLKGKINGTVEYFYRRTTNFLTNPTSCIQHRWAPTSRLYGLIVHSEELDGIYS
ncbi:MAG: hypothetical protein WDO19_12240 [Bacteroidota bacterium]